MIKDIELHQIEDVKLAVVKELNEEKTAEVFNVYFINLKDTKVENVMVSSRGYGVNLTTDEKIETSRLRHFIGDVEGKDYAKIELIMEDLFSLNNEYWVSLYEGKQIQEKKFIFLAESISETNFVDVPVLNKKGVLI